MLLYKYLNSERKDILKNKEIRFTQPESFNDPFEFFPFIQQITTEKEFINLQKSQLLNYDNEEFVRKNVEVVLKERFDFLPSELVKEIKDNPELIAILKFTIGQEINNIKKLFTGYQIPFNIEVSKKIKEIANKKFGILCLSETPDNLIMWAHYANCHTGFLIGFDSEHPYFDQKISQNDQIRFLSAVTYTIKRAPSIMLDENVSEDEGLKRLISQFFLTKSIHWREEKEWRMITALENASRVDKEIYLYNIPHKCISEIIIGCKMNKETKEEIVQLIQSDTNFLHVKLKEANLSYDEYSLSIGELNMPYRNESLPGIF